MPGWPHPFAEPVGEDFRTYEREIQRMLPVAFTHDRLAGGLPLTPHQS
jgi:hypothetical protein